MTFAKNNELIIFAQNLDLLYIIFFQKNPINYCSSFLKSFFTRNHELLIVHNFWQKKTKNLYSGFFAENCERMFTNFSASFFADFLQWMHTTKHNHSFNNSGVQSRKQHTLWHYGIQVKLWEWITFEEKLSLSIEALCGITLVEKTVWITDSWTQACESSTMLLPLEGFGWQVHGGVYRVSDRTGLIWKCWTGPEYGCVPQ